VYKFTNCLIKKIKIYDIANIILFLLILLKLVFCTMSKNLEIDNVDLKILSLLMENANMPYTEIGKKIFVSGGTVHVRMKKMEQMGIVKGAQLTIDYAKLGWDITAFLGIYLDKSSLYEDVSKELNKIPEVVNIHYTTGIYSIFAKLICRDTQHLRQVLHDKIQKVGGIQRTETFISLDESINRPFPFGDTGIV
jgi:Lrp/AsnC family transcriptional regulator for asnA, asnC and gidA